MPALTYYATFYREMAHGAANTILQCMQASDRQALHLTALDMISSQFRERMCGSITANPISSEVLEEAVGEPFPAASSTAMLDDAVESFAQTALDQEPLPDEIFL